MEDLIQRNHYLKQVTPYIGKDIIKVLVGQRRVGKSYMMYQIMDIIRRQKPGNPVIYINKELHEFESIKNNTDLITYVKAQTEKSPEKTYLFIDEIQDIEGFEKALRSLLAEKQYDIYITRSNANLLSGELATYLSGRYIEVKLYGLSFPEFLQFHKLENNNESFQKYIRYGGLPFLINLPLEDVIIYDYLKNIYSTILYRDIVSRHSIRNTVLLERLVEFIADNTGSIVSAKKISDFLKSQNIKMSPNIILNYLSHLTAAFFLFRVKRSDVAGKKIFEIGEKYYFEDLGLRHTVIGYKLGDINKILENLVYLHLLISGYSVTTGELHPGEIDFIGTRGNAKIYIQVTYLIPDEKVFRREFGNLLTIKDNYPKLVISMDETTGNDHEGIRHLHIREFLSNYI